MTKIYFVRHAESDFNVIDDRSRPLTQKGHVDCALVTDFLQSKEIDVIFSSPYKRAIDTITEFAKSVGIPIHIVEDFREREHALMEGDWRPYTKKQWSDFSYSLPNEECLADVQKRNIAALNDVLSLHKNKNIAIGTHGMALSTIINFYDINYGFDEFMEMVFLNPWVVIIDFDEFNCTAIEKINLLE
jgi:2,3-bisphosphoglycerate-dependent phosphoglycerate mutase